MLKITTSLVVASSLLLVGGCSKKKEEGTAQKPAEGVAATPPPPPPPVEGPKTLTGTALADKYKACVVMIGDGKLDDFRKDCIDDSFQAHDYGDGSTHKPDELIGWFKSMKAGMPDFKLAPQIVLVSGRNILAVELVTGTNSAPMKTPMGEQPATNKKIGLLMFHRLAFNDANKATEEWAYSDPMAMMGQLGMAPKDVPPARAALDKGVDAPIVVVTADDAKEKANLAAGHKAVDALNAGKFEDLTAMLAPDATESDQADVKDSKGAKDIEAGTKMWFGAFKGAKVSVDQDYAAGDYVVHLGKFSGNHDKDLGKLKKTGKDVNVDYAEVMFIKDGKLAQIWRFHSGLVFAQQLGLAPPMGAPPAAGSAAPKAEEKK